MTEPAWGRPKPMAMAVTPSGTGGVVKFACFQVEDAAKKPVVVHHCHCPSASRL